jgi:hypothetical protein
MLNLKSTAIAFAALVAASALHAAGTLSVSPAVVMLRGNAGQSTTQKLTIVNATDQTFTFEMVAQDVVVRGGKRSFSDAGALAGSIAGSAVFSRRTVSVGAGERATVDVTLTVPANAAARAVVAVFRGTTRIHGQRGDFTASIGSLLTFTLSGGATATASALALTPPTSARNLSVSQQLANSGAEPVFARGMLAILDGAGSLVVKQSIPPVRLLPGESAPVRAEFAGELAAGRYRALVTWDLEGAHAITSQKEFEVR